MVAKGHVSWSSRKTRKNRLKTMKKLTTDYRKKMSKTLRGKKHRIPTEEEKRRHSEAIKRVWAKIRKRDNYTCQLCLKTQKELREKLSIRHIDYNKKNNKPNNLISLCNSCLSKTEQDRAKWIRLFRKKIKELKRRVAKMQGF